MAQCGGTESAEARGRKSGGESKRKMRRRREEKKERRDSFLSLSPSAPPPQSSLFASTLPVPPHRAIAEENKENFQNRSYHMIIHERDKKGIWIYHLRRKRSDFTFRAILAVDSLWSGVVIIVDYSRDHTVVNGVYYFFSIFSSFNLRNYIYVNLLRSAK